MSRDFTDQLQLRLTSHETRQLMRKRVVHPDHYLNFTSHDYLSQGLHPEIIAAQQQALTALGTSALGSPVAKGYTLAHQQLETRLATWLNYPRALVFTSGYLAIIASITALIGKKDFVAIHKQCHASVLDGIALTQCTWQRYEQLDRLENILQNSCEGLRFIVTSSVLSMQGNLADLKQLSQIAQKYNAILIVDDVHGTGILGDKGQGAHAYFGLNEKDIPLIIGSLTKGLGTVGAFVAGNDIIIESILQFSRPYMFSTTLPGALAISSIKAIDIAEQSNEKRAHLNKLIDYFCEKMRDCHFSLLQSTTPIQAIVFEDIASMQAIASKLLQKNILVAAIRPPTVPKDSPRIRITLNAAHQFTDIDRLVAELKAHE